MGKVRSFSGDGMALKYFTKEQIHEVSRVAVKCRYCDNTAYAPLKREKYSLPPMCEECLAKYIAWWRYETLF